MRSGIWYTTAATLITLVVSVCCAVMLEGAGRAGALSGAVVAFAVQVLGFWLLFVWMFPGHQGLAYGLGVLGRMVLVMFAALWAVPVVGLPLAPTLLSLVAVLFLTTLSEPIVLRLVSPETR